MLRPRRRLTALVITGLSVPHLYVSGDHRTDFADIDVERVVDCYCDCRDHMGFPKTASDTTSPPSPGRPAVACCADHGNLLMVAVLSLCPGGSPGVC